MTTIADVHGREVIDSRGNPTVEVEISLESGALDGFRVDRDGNRWCGWGSTGAPNDEPTVSPAGRCIS